MAKSGALLQWNQHWTSASNLMETQAEPKFPQLPLPALKSLLAKGLARGVIAEVSGQRSTGRTALVLHALAESSRRGEICAIVDLQNSFDPASAARAGVCLDHLVWIRCGGNAEHAMRAADLLLHAGGFGLVLLDICEASTRVLNRIPLSYWYRFSRAIQNTPTVLLVCSDAPQVKSCSSATVEISRKNAVWSGKKPFSLLRSILGSATVKAASQPVRSSSIQMVA
jgi:hypothetical protein